MNHVTEQIYQAALQLSDDERSDLIDALLASQASPGEFTFDPEWLAEIQRRSAELDSGRVECTPWSIVRERVRRRLEELPSD